MIDHPFIVMAAISTGLMTSAGFLLVADHRRRAHKTRVAGVISLYAPAVVSGSKVSASFGTRLMLSRTARRLFNILGIDPMRRDLYPAPWPVLVGGVAIVVTAIVGILEMLVGPIAWAALPIGWVFVTRWLFASFRARHANLLYIQFPDALTMIVRSVRAGLPVPEALRVVAEEAQLPTTTEFGRLYDDLRLGGSLPEALMKLAGRTTLLEYRFFAVSLALQSQSGGNLSEALENLADVIRKRVALKDRAIALASEAKMTMYVLAALPFITTGALVIISPEYISQLFYTSTGRTLLAIGISLLAAGIVSMRVIIRKSVS